MLIPQRIFILALFKYFDFNKLLNIIKYFINIYRVIINLLSLVRVLLLCELHILHWLLKLVLLLHLIGLHKLIRLLVLIILLLIIGLLKLIRISELILLLKLVSLINLILLVIELRLICTDLLSLTLETLKLVHVFISKILILI